MSWAVSTMELYDGSAAAQAGSGRSRQLLRVAWQTLYAKYQKLSDFLRRGTNKPLPKELRKSLRLNKSARRKGYNQHESKADKQLLEAYLNQPININIRMGPAYEYIPSNC